jgi:outer membrane protein TolC
MIPPILMRFAAARRRSPRGGSVAPGIPMATAFMAVVLALAAPVAAESLTIEAAVAGAMAGNPRVLAAAGEVAAARGRALQLAARPEPQLSAAIEGASLPGQGREGEAAEVHLGIEQLFEFPGKRALRQEIGRLGAEIAAAELERVRRIVAAEVKRAYWKAVFAQEAARALDKSAGRLDQLLGDLEARYNSGTGSFADVLRARTEKARLRNQVLEQEKERRLAALELNELLARPAAEPVDLATAMVFAPLALRPEAAWQEARSANSFLRTASLRSERAAAAMKLAGLGRSPDLLAGFSLPSVRAGAWGISLGLSLPFLRPDRGRGLVLEAGAEMDNARLAAVTAERRARTAIASAYTAARSAEEQVQVFERDLLRDLEDELRIQLEYFRFGKGEAYGLLDLQRTFALAELEHLRAVFLYHIALADLEVAGEELP